MPLPKLFTSLIAILLFCKYSLSFGQVNSSPLFYFYEDSSKSLTEKSALSLYEQGKFVKLATQELNIGFTRSVFWLGYVNDTELPTDSLLLFIGHHHINRIHFYYAANNIIRQQWITGDYYPFIQRPVNATGFYFPINKKGFYLARIDKSNESLQLSFALSSRLAMLSVESKQTTMMAIFTGMILLMIIFGIYLFIISRDKIYIYYVLYITTGWLWVLANAGYGFQYLWPHMPWFASKARPVFALAPLIFSMLFLLKYIGGIRSKKILLSIKITNGLLMACILSVFFFNEQGYQSLWWYYIQFFIPLISLFFLLLTLGVLFTAAWKGNKPAIFYLAAIGVLVVFTFLQIFFSFGKLQGAANFFSSFWLALGYVVEIIILTAGLVYRFNQYRIDKENLLLKINRQQQENTRIIMEVQEAERSQVANQLHDVAGSLLSAARLNLTSLREKQGADSVADFHLQKTEEAISMVSDMVRNLSHALSPVMLEKVGFKTSLEKIISIVNASGKINIQLLLIGFEKYEPRLNTYYTALYGIIYELLNNTVKHSGAKNVLLQLAEYEDCFSLIAEDDGLGISPEIIIKHQSLGIAGIQSKINFLKGSVAFDKNIPQGLIVTIEIPIPAYET